MTGRIEFNKSTEILIGSLFINKNVERLLFVFNVLLPNPDFRKMFFDTKGLFKLLYESELKNKLIIMSLFQTF